MESNYYEKDKLLVFKIVDEIDEFSAQKIRREADYEIKRYMPRKVIFDFDSVTFMDSAGIGLIIGRYKFVNMLKSIHGNSIMTRYIITVNVNQNHLNGYMK